MALFGWHRTKRDARPYAALTPSLAAQLRAVPPSRDGRLEYYPCRVTLDDGRRLDCVYVVDADAYIKMWGVWPEDDPGKSSVRIEQVVGIEESPFRIPPPLANQLYKAGESGMGYTLFQAEFADGTKQTCVTGNAVDFIALPPGLRGSDVVRVIPHAGRGENPHQSPDYFWCLHRTPK